MSLKITTEHIYLGGYAIVISVSFFTILLARRAARTQDLEEAMKKLEQNTAPPTPAKRASGDAQEPQEGIKEDE